MFSSGKVRQLGEEEPWGLDNGAWQAHLDGTDFEPDAFLRRLDQAVEASEEFHPPLVAVVPDIVCGGLPSLDFSLEWMETLWDRTPTNWPWYLAVQLGMATEEIRPVLAEEIFDGIFLGGGHVMKASGRRWRNLAREFDLPFHYAQCGTKGKLQHAFELEATSLDSVGPITWKVKFREFYLYYHALERRHGSR